MAFIDLTATPDSSDPGLTNYERLYARRPQVYEAWKQLAGAIRGSMTSRRYELATFAAARRLGSSYCSLAHGQVLADDHLDAAQMLAIAQDHHTAGLDDVEVAVMDLAAQVAADAGAVGQADVDRLRALGLTDDEIFDVVLTAAARAFFSKSLDGIGVEPDAAYLELDPALRGLLAVGRPIARPAAPARSEG